MRLGGIVLHTHYFEDYLSFLTEILEFELEELTDISMRLNSKDIWIEIKKIPQSLSQMDSTLEFVLNEEEYEAMVNKITFFFYRKGPNRFLFLDSQNDHCEVVDPDGRVWKFKLSSQLFPSLDILSETVRNC